MEDMHIVTAEDVASETNTKIVIKKKISKGTNIGIIYLPKELVGVDVDIYIDSATFSKIMAEKVSKL
jgi:hypothetical protein